MITIGLCVIYCLSQTTITRFVFYRLGNLDNRIPNADQLLTTDVEKFCASITEVTTKIALFMIICTLFLILMICLYFHLNIIYI